jgi:osmotically-inducible protein OsmY
MDVRKPRASVSDVESRIEAAFRRNAEVDVRKVRVGTNAGKVIPPGAVRCWAERQKAKTAWSAPGVIQSRI